MLILVMNLVSSTIINIVSALFLAIFDFVTFQKPHSSLQAYFSFDG